ncbi:MAG: NAD(P)-dependent oxidoreductase [Spirochaetaceae bacterium]
MRIAVFGGTGKTGWPAVRYAIDSGYGCKVLTRNPERMPSTPGVEFVEGNATNGGKVMLTLTGCNAVLVALKRGKKAPEGLLTTALSHIINGMKKLEIQRLVVLGILGTDGTLSQLPLSRRLSLSSVNKKELEDLEAMENLVSTSGLEWTILRPAVLTEEDRTGRIRPGTDRETKAGPIGREDLASFAVGEIEKKAYVGAKPYIDRVT